MVIALDPMVQATDWLVWVTAASVIVAAIAVVASIIVARNERQAARRERIEQRSHDPTAALAVLRMELRLNRALTQDKQEAKENESTIQADVAGNFVPLERAALNASLGYIAHLPAEVQRSVEHAALQMARYNALVGRQVEIRWLARELQATAPLIDHAIARLDDYLGTGA